MRLVADPVSTERLKLALAANAEQLKQTLNRVYGAAAGPFLDETFLKSLHRPDITRDERLSESVKLTQMLNEHAFKSSPLRRLDELELELARDTLSYDKTRALLARFGISPDDVSPLPSLNHYRFVWRTERDERQWYTEEFAATTPDVAIQVLQGHLRSLNLLKEALVDHQAFYASPRSRRAPEGAFSLQYFTCPFTIMVQRRIQRRGSTSW